MTFLEVLALVLTGALLLQTWWAMRQAALVRVDAKEREEAIWTRSQTEVRHAMNRLLEVVDKAARIKITEKAVAKNAPQQAAAPLFAPPAPPNGTGTEYEPGRRRRDMSVAGVR